jgi:glycosyltransferase involved in cell wall biosynthesis
MIPGLVSILIPTYNRERYIGEAIESVLGQDYPSKEIIVVDDGSTDGTRDIVARYGEVKYFYQENAGIAAARNACLVHAGGEYIAWLDSDDYYLPGKLSAQVEYLEAHPEADIVFCPFKNFFEDESVKSIKRVQDDIRAEKDKYGQCLASSLARKGVYDKVGGFDTSLPIAEDPDWLYRAQYSCGIDASHCLAEAFYMRRLHSANSIVLCKEEPSEVRRRLYMNFMRQRAKNGTKK